MKVTTGYAHRSGVKSPLPGSLVRALSKQGMLWFNFILSGMQLRKIYGESKLWFREDCGTFLWQITGGGVLPYKGLIGMCRWMGSHFHGWSDYNGVAFSIELLGWGRKFSDFWGK